MAQKRSAVLTQMQDIARTARGVAREVPGIDRDCRIPRRRAAVALVTTARSMLAAVEGIAEKFVRLGLAPSFVEDLRTAADALEKSHDLQQSGRKALTEAQTGIGLAMTRAFDAIRMLDIVVANTLKSDPVRFAGWKRIRRLEGQRRAGSSSVKVDVSSALVPVVDEPNKVETIVPPASSADTPEPTLSSETLDPVALTDGGLRRVS